MLMNSERMQLIDPHVHLRDYDQFQKETLAHGLTTADRIGFSAVFEMPNTSPPVITRADIERRIAAADAALDETGVHVFHGLYAGLTSSETQIAEAVKAHAELFPRVVGLKLFAGPSTGSLGIMKRDERRAIYQKLADEHFTGVLAVHCEDPEYFQGDFRPPEAETASIREQIQHAAESGFAGTLHICHLTLPESLSIIEAARAEAGFRISCGVTPHHLLLADDLLQSENGFLFRVNPPLRKEFERKALFQAVLDGRVGWLESDHAPHTLHDKLEDAAGLPGLPGMALCMSRLIDAGISWGTLVSITGERQREVFGLPEFPHAGTVPDPEFQAESEAEFREQMMKAYEETAKEYPWNPYQHVQ